MSQEQPATAGDSRSKVDFDVVVIGAGPAGSVAARELARRGARVLLLDKSHFPRAKVCGCCINGAGVRTLRQLGLGSVLTSGVPLQTALLAAGRHSARVLLPGGVALSREVFDAELVAEAVRAGVEFRPGVTAKLGACEPVALSVVVGAQTIRARVAILASGLTGSDGEPEVGSRIGAGVTVAADAAPAFFVPGTIFMATARGGYVGLVRVEDGRLDIAAAFDVAFVKGHGGPGLAAEAILVEAGWPRVVGLAEMSWRGTPALTRRARTLAGERWFAIGDAAGYVEPFTGEGMAWAVISSAAVVPLATRAVRNWDTTLVREWSTLHRRCIGPRQRVCRVVSRVLRWPALTTVAVRALSVFPALARPVVATINRPSPIRQGGRV